MDKNKIVKFFQLGNMLDKMSEEELKTPQGQMLQQQFFALQSEYDEWKATINDPVKLQEMQKQMEIDEALGILATALNAYLSSPLPKPVGNEVYQAAFDSLVTEVKTKKSETKEKKV